ncbi:efflux RND transporter permease subunit [Ketobacter sp.]|nr:MAG: hypothetical protein D6160_11495 [Ketobacter sp.]
MTAWKARVERGFGVFAGRLYDSPKKMLTLLLVCLITLATQLQHIYFDTSTEGFLSPDHPAVRAYDQFREEFGRDELVIIGVQAENVLAPQFLTQFQRLYQTLEQQLPASEAIDSMINARYVYGRDDELFVEKLFDPWPHGKAEFIELRRRINSNPLYKGLYLDDVLSMATIVVRLQYVTPEPGVNARQQLARANEKTARFLQQLEQSLQPFRDQGMHLSVAGSPVVTDLLRTAMITDMQTFSKWIVCIIAILLFLLFRRASGVLLPLVCVLLSVVFTISLMGLFRQPLQLPTAIVPSFLLVVGIGDAIHFLSFFYAEFNQHGDKKASVIKALEHSGLAMFLTSLTTAAGMASFANADLLPISNLGVFTAVGVMSAFVMTIIVLPACISLLPLKPGSNDKAPHTSVLLNTLIDKAAHVSYYHPKKVIFVSFITLIAAMVAVLQMNFSHNPLKWLPDTLPAKQSIVTIDQQLGGSVSLEVLVDTGEQGGIHEPEFLRNLDALCQQLGAFSTPQFSVNKVLSITDLIKESNRALHNNDQRFYTIPETRELVAQELFLLELSGADDLFRLVDRDYRKARITLTLPWIDALLYAPLMDNLEQRFHDSLGASYQVTITGLIPLLGSTLNSVIHSAAEAYVIALVVISFIMVLLMGRLKLGLISMFPNILPIVMVIGLMQLNDVPFDMFSILIGSIAIGLCVDDTVHFMHHFGRYREKGYSVKDAIDNTLHTAGRAMLVTSVVLCSGFLVLTLSELNNFTHFGIYTSLCIVLALLADFLLAPALMTLLNKHD